VLCLIATPAVEAPPPSTRTPGWKRYAPPAAHPPPARADRNAGSPWHGVTATGAVPPAPRLAKQVGPKFPRRTVPCGTPDGRPTNPWPPPAAALQRRAAPSGGGGGGGGALRTAGGRRARRWEGVGRQRGSPAGSSAWGARKLVGGPSGRFPTKAYGAKNSLPSPELR